MAHLYCKLLQQELKADAFQLRMAGARYQLDVAEGGNGIVLQVIGFRDKMHLLAKKVSESLISLNLLQSWRQVKDQQEQHGLVDDEALSCFEKQHQTYFRVCPATLLGKAG